MKNNQETNTSFDWIESAKMLFSKTKSALKNIDGDTLGFLNDTSAIIATIVALVTIIFTVFNEKVIQTVEDFIKEIESLLPQFTDDKKAEIIDKFNMIQDLSLKRDIYDTSMRVFKITLIVLAIPWGIAGISYMLKSSNFFEVLISLIATVTLLIIFIYIPKLFSQFNNLKNPNIVSFSIIEFINFIREKSSLSNLEVIKHFYNPVIKLSYKDRAIHVDLEQKIKLKDVTIVLSLKKDRDFHLLVLKPMKQQFIDNKYKIDCPTNISLDGFFENMKSVTGTNNKLYIVSGDTSFTFTLNLNKEDNAITAKINQGNTDSLPNPIKESLKENDPYISSKVNGVSYKYNLKKL